VADRLFTIEGADEVVKLLQSAPRVVVATGFLKALQAGAKPIVDQLEARTPERDEGERNEETPHLKDNITVDIQLDSQFRGGFADIGFGKLGYIANFVEYGHRMLTHDEKEIGKIEPKPFMRPAAEAAAEAAIDAFADALTTELSGTLGRDVLGVS
jgi:HK97 gp10 family phage protein